MRKMTMLRRAAAALALSVGVLAVTAPGAGAASARIPAILDGFSNTTALKVKLTVPAIDDLKTRLADAGVPTAAIPATSVGPITLEQAISVNSANARKSGSNASAQGFAAPAIGNLLNSSVRTSCSASSCTDSESVGPVRTSILDQAVPGGIGRIDLYAADSVTKTFLDTTNGTGLVQVNLDASKLLAPGGQLAVVGGALTTLANTVNTAVLPVVNPAIQNLIDTVDGTAALAPVRDELYRYITLGQIKQLPDPAQTQLLGLDVLSSTANVVQDTRKGVTGLLSTATANVADLKILGGWVSIDSIRLSASAFANGEKAEALADNNAKVLGATLGGLLNADISSADLKRLADPDTLKNVIRDTVPGLDAQVEDVAAAIDILYKTAGVKVELLPTTKVALPNGRFARSEIGTLRITVAPKIPLLANGHTPAGSLVPRLADDDYLSTGLSLVVDLPAAEVQASAGAVKCVGRCTVTGVGTPWIAALLMIAAGFTAKRYGFAR